MVYNKSQQRPRITMRHLVDEYHRMESDEKAALEKARRNEKARRQFLMYLVFFILAVAVKFHKDIDAATSRMYAKVAPGEEPRRAKQSISDKKLAEISMEAEQTTSAR